MLSHSERLPAGVKRLRAKTRNRPDEGEAWAGDGTDIRILPNAGLRGPAIEKRVVRFREPGIFRCPLNDFCRPETFRHKKAGRKGRLETR